jgi:hypothetical protein
MVALITVVTSAHCLAVDLSGHVGVEHRQFFQRGQDGQHDSQDSLVLEPELYWESDNGDSAITFTPFTRVDSMDEQRTHADIRELSWLQVLGDYEIRAGISEIFWGVTESAHLVDVINQTDAVESPDGEDKLGQPMVDVAKIADWGRVDAFLLPYFRTRTFAGKDGRLRTDLPVDTNDAQFESSRKQKHVDGALRYANSFGDWDIGVSYFRGTNRDPYLQYQRGQLIPYYAQMDQVGLDVQNTSGDWLWKLETIYRNSLDEHVAAVSGFEYTEVGFWQQSDLGIILEYLYDSRGNNDQSEYQNDVFYGLRFTFNDVNGTEILAGVTQDLDDPNEYIGKIEASSRINNYFKWNINAWLFDRRIPDDFLDISIKYYF